MLVDSLYETFFKRVYEDSIELGNVPKKIRHDYSFYQEEQSIIDQFQQTSHLNLCLHEVDQKYHTPRVCLAAVRNNGHNLQLVKQQTEELCLAAVTQNPNALYYVHDHFMIVWPPYLETDRR